MTLSCKRAICYGRRLWSFSTHRVNTADKIPGVFKGLKALFPGPYTGPFH